MPAYSKMVVDKDNDFVMHLLEIILFSKTSGIPDLPLFLPVPVVPFLLVEEDKRPLETAVHLCVLHRLFVSYRILKVRSLLL